LAKSLLESGYDVEVHEIKDSIFAGASGAIPARLHRGFHYPRSQSTRDACNSHYAEFMEKYGQFTSSIPTNIYAIAAHESLVDFETYRHILKDSVEYITIEHPEEFGLQNVEGALLTGERHIVVSKTREYFKKILDGHIFYSQPYDISDDNNHDWIIDATFCANENVGVERYEPCLVPILEGPNVTKAITIMDGPFPSLYPWNEEKNLLSLSSALWTPFSKTCKTYNEAKQILESLSKKELVERGDSMIQSMAHFYPAVNECTVKEYKTSIRAMPKSGSDARLVEVLETQPNVIRIRAGKIDAVIDAERAVKNIIQS